MDDKVCYTHNFKLPENITSDTDVFVITSVITPSDNMLFYSRRSIYTPIDRFLQTIKTCTSIRQKVPDSVIILLEVSELTEIQLYILKILVDKIVLFHAEKLSYDYTNIHPNKSFGEVFKMLFISLHLDKIPFKRLFKLSGRYYLNDSFSIHDYSLTNYSFKVTKKYNENSEIIDAAFYTIIYSIPKNTINSYYNLLIKFLNNITNQCPYSVDIEHYLYSKITDENYTVSIIENLGVSGKQSHTVEELTW